MNLVGWYMNDFTRHSALVGLCPVIRWVDWAHLDVLANSRHKRTRYGAATEVCGTETLRLPLLPRIRGLFQRDHEPHCEYRVETGKEVSSATNDGVDRVNLQPIRTGLCEEQTVNCKLLLFELIAYSQSGNLLTDTLEC